MGKNLLISEKHGVNPSMLHCFYCHEPVGVAMHGRLPGDAEAPRAILDYSMEPCDECKKRMKQGIQIVEAEGMMTVHFESDGRQKRGGEIGRVDGKLCESVKMPRTTGSLWVVTEQWVSNLPPQLAEQGLKARMMLIEPKTARAIGLYDLKGGDDDGGKSNTA